VHVRLRTNQWTYFQTVHYVWRALPVVVDEVRDDAGEVVGAAAAVRVVERHGLQQRW